MQYVGLDLGSKASQLCVQLSDTEFFEQRIPTTRESFQRYFAPGQSKRVLLEASTMSEWVAQTLEELGHEAVVGDPNFALMYATRSRRIKTDRRDARALCEACRMGTYRKVVRRSDESRCRERQLAVREALVSARTQMINVCRAMLRSEGIKAKSGAAESFVQRVRELELPTATSAVIEPLMATLLTLCEQIKDCDRRLKEAAAEDEIIRRLMTAPGVGVITATAFRAVIEEVERFASAKQVRAYLGLVPSESSSSERRRLGHITKAGNARLRWLLVEAGWNILLRESEKNRQLRRWALKIAERRGRRIAAVALARKLAGILYALWRDATSYTSGGRTVAVAAASR